MRRVNLLHDLAGDLAYAVRLLRKWPGFALAAILTLALGIGANTAVFSVIDSVLLRPLPFRDADRLLVITEYGEGVPKTGSPLLRYQTRAAQNNVFSETAAYWDVSGGNGMVLGGDSAEHLQFSIVAGGFFSILGVKPVIGRTFSQQEEAPGGGRVFLASYGTWQRFLGGSPSAIGKAFRLDGVPYTLIGVLPQEFHFPGNCAIWTATGTMGAWPSHDRVSHQFWMLGRLKPSATAARAQAEMDAIQKQLAVAYPDTDANWRVNVRPLMDEFVGGVRVSLWVMFGAVGFVLLIACSNVVNLLLARATAREREFAVRAALGARRARLVRQTVAETLLLATAGAALALVFAKFGLEVMVKLNARSIPRFEQPQLSAGVLAFSAGLAILSTLLVGFVPGLQASRLALFETLRDQRSGSDARHSVRLRNLLAVCEIALTVLLLSGAGLMLRSFQRLREVDTGFHADRVITMPIALPNVDRSAAQRIALLHELLEDLNRTPGIEMAAATDRIPLSGESNWGRINVVGRPLLDSAHAPSVEARAVSANYFRTLGIRLLRGREFDDSDVLAQRRVTVINQAMANQFWPGGDPVGQRLVSPYNPGQMTEIIGVVANIKDFALDLESPPEMYSPYSWWSTMNLVVRSNEDAATIIRLLRVEVAKIDPQVPIYDIMPLTELLKRSIGRQRFELLLLGIFASIALLLAVVGIYGLLAFTVGQRTQEMGLRIALGANPSGVVRMVVAQGFKLVAFGLLCGLLASFALTSLMRSLLYGVSPHDPVTLAAVITILAATGAVACWIPARRILRVDPMIALRRG